MSLAFVAVGLAAFIGMAALAVDLGMLYVARSQAQRAADAAALAAGVEVWKFGGDHAAARAAAEQYGLENDILGQPTVIRDEDVTFPSDDTVRVWVRRTRARGNAVPTIFARILGIDQVDVVTRAAARAFPAGGVDCVLPIMIPDRWEELGGNPAYYDDGIDRYQPWKNSDGTINSDYTGYSQADYGVQITIRGFQNPGTANSSWYYPFRQPGMSGAADYRAAIRGENCGGADSPDYDVNDSVATEPGAMIGPTNQGFDDLIAMDPDAEWDEGKDCVINLTTHPDGACVGSPRIRPMPLFDPTEVIDPGVSNVEITNFAALFVEGVTSSGVTGRFMGYTGVHPGPQPDGSAGPLSVVIVLVE